jgi:potassium/hydrogen antiporter
MFDTSIIFLVVGGLVLASIIASRISDRIGMPALIVFLCIGMLAGSDGPGGIHFEDAQAANLVGTLALAFILFSGGLDTNWRIIRPVLSRGIVLSTVGVLATAGLVGLFTWLVLGLPPITAFLLGAIISSTDAAAVFSILRGRGVGLKGNVKPLLELESGSNDPMAVFLTLGMTQLLLVPEFNVASLVPAFFISLAGGVAVGYAAGKAAGFLFNQIQLFYEGLYPVLSIGVVLLTFGAAQIVGGNGFLAVYICGVLLNAADFRYKRYVIKFHDGLAWLMQIGMFLVLGLLVFPSQLPGVAAQALLIAVFLMLVARPAAVFGGLLGSTFSWAERTLVSWTGLRGAVPIVLATFPMLAGYEDSAMIFDIVFFIVLTSVLVQGSLLMPIARRLRVDEPLASRPAFSLELDYRGQTQGETREIEVLPNMRVIGRTIADLGIPPDVLVLLIGRAGKFVVPRGQTKIEPYDTLLLFGAGPSLQAAIDVIVSPPPPVRVPVTPVDPLAALPYTTEPKYLSKQVVLVGYGRVGRRVGEALAQRAIPYVVIDENREIIEQLREAERPAVLGDASQDITLAQGHVARAAVLIIATPDTMKVRQIVDNARRLNPEIEIVIRTHSEMEATLLNQEKAGKVFLGEEELAKSITAHVLARMPTDDGAPAPDQPNPG